MNKCEEFLKKEASDKMTYCKSNGICYGCFRKNHIYRFCKWKDDSLMKNDNRTDGQTGQTRTDSSPRVPEAAATSMPTSASDGLNVPNNQSSVPNPVTNQIHNNVSGSVANGSSNVERVSLFTDVKKESRSTWIVPVDLKSEFKTIRTYVKPI